MTADDIDAIRTLVERHAAAIGPGGEKAWTAGHLAAKVPALLAKVDELTAELERWKGKAERYRDMHDRAAQELSAERVKTMKVAMVQCWTNEDGKRFVFVTDLQAAMGVSTDPPPESTAAGQ